MSHRLRRVISASAPLLAVALLPATAHAAAAPTHLVSLDQARKDLPASSAMPGHPQTVVTTTIGGLANGNPCTGPQAKPLAFKHSRQVSSLYIGKFTSPSAQPTQFLVSAIVFHTTADARAGMATIVRTEKHCPKQQGDSSATVTRTLSGSYAANGWKGWRTVAKVAVAADPSDPIDSGLEVRINTEYLQRGNVVLLLSESGSNKPGTAAKQDADRRQATKAMLAGFAAS
jgi:hypothetical protein